MVNPQPLPETVKPREFEMNTDTALSDYIAMRSINAIQVAQAVGVVLQSMSYRLYDNRIMWRLTCSYDEKLTNDEVRRIMWDLAVKGLGAHEPAFYRGDDTSKAEVVAVWFTDGGRQAIQGIKF